MKFTELLYPPKCPSCGELVPFGGFFGSNVENQSALCPECLPLWEREKEEECGACGEMVINCQCATKMMQSAGCKVFRKLVYYRPGNRNEIGNRVAYRIKDHADRHAVNFLAEELAPGIRESMSAAEWSEKSFFLVYLPRRSGIVLKNGNDQAKELALSLAKLLSLPLIPAIGRRAKNRTPQKFLGSAKRLSNAKGAFYFREKYKSEIAGKVAILIDDIVTSGASMTAGIRVLRRAGAKGFLAVAVASDECNRNPPVVTPETKSELDYFSYRRY